MGRVLFTPSPVRAMVGCPSRGATMIDDRFQQIERLIEEAGGCFDPASGVFDAIGDDEQDVA